MIQVRRCTWRGVDGWKVCGRREPGVGWPVSIFARTESVARRIATKVRAGEDICSDDWEGDEC